MATRFELDGKALQTLLVSPSGPVAADLNRRGKRVESRAKVLAPVDKGRGRASITTELGTVRGSLCVRIGTNVAYMRYQHNGTGIYGPRGTPIVPRNGKWLVWNTRSTRAPRKTAAGRTVRHRSLAPTGKAFAKSVRGVRPRPFLTRALPAAAD